MERKWQGKIAIIALCVGIVVLLIYLLERPRPGFFLRRAFAALQHQHQTGTVVINLTGSSPVQSAFTIILAELLGIKITQTMFIPLGLIGRGVMYFTITYHLLQRIDIASGMGITMVFLPWTSWGFNTIWVHSVGGFLFLFLVLCALLGLHRRLSNRIHSIIILTLFTLLLWDYTSAVWAIIFFFMLGVFTWAYDRPRLISNLKYEPQGFITIAIIGGMVYSLKIVVYTTIAALFLPGTEIASTVPPEFAYNPPNRLDLSSLFYAVIAISSVPYFIYKGREILTKRQLNLSNLEMVIGSFGIAGAGGMVLYLVLGRFTPAFIFLSSPLLGLSALVGLHHLDKSPISDTRLQTVITTFVIIIVVISSAAFTLQWQRGTLHSFSETNSAPAGYWLGTYSEEATIMTDMVTRGRIKLPEKKTRSEFRFVRINATTYAHLIRGDSVPATYILLDRKAKATYTNGWGVYKPLAGYQSHMDSDVSKQVIYSSGGLRIYYAGDDEVTSQ